MWKENNMYYPNYCQCNNYGYNYPNSDYNDYNDSCYNNTGIRNYLTKLKNNLEMNNEDLYN